MRHDTPYETCDRWGLILAGGDGTRLRTLTRRIENDDRPKQFCRIIGRETLLDRTRRRTALVIPSARTLVLVTRRHERFYAPLLEDAPPGCVVRQAENRGTAPAILYGLLRVAAAAPMGALGVFPSDYFVADDSAFMGHVAVAFEVVRARPDLIVLLGVDADHPERRMDGSSPEMPSRPDRGEASFAFAASGKSLRGLLPRHCSRPGPSGTASSSSPRFPPCSA